MAATWARGMAGCAFAAALPFALTTAAAAQEISEPYLELDQLEVQIGDGEEAAQWDFVAGLETPIVAFTLKSEGDIETQTGRVDSAEAEARISRRLGNRHFAFGGGRFAKIEGREVAQAVVGFGGEYGDGVFDLSLRLFEAQSVFAEVHYEFALNDSLIIEPGFEVEAPFKADGVRDRDRFEPEFEVALGLISVADYGVFANEVTFSQDASERTLYFATEYSGWPMDGFDLIPEFDFEVTFPRDTSENEPSRSYEATVKFAAGFEDTAIQPYTGLIYEREVRSRANEARTGLSDSDRLLFLFGAQAEY